MFRIDVQSARLEEVLAEASVSLLDTTPLMAGIAAELLDQTEQNFAAQGRPKWAPLKYPRPPGLEGPILQRSGAGGLASSITSYHGPNEAGVGSNKPYAAIHQLGGQTSAHVIKARNKKALHFGGRFARQVNHPGSSIPPRPYLPFTAGGGLQPEAEEAIVSVVQTYLRGVLGG